MVVHEVGDAVGEEVTAVSSGASEIVTVGEAGGSVFITQTSARCTVCAHTSIIKINKNRNFLKTKCS